MDITGWHEFYRGEVSMSMRERQGTRMLAVGTDFHGDSLLSVGGFIDDVSRRPGISKDDVGERYPTLSLFVFGELHHIRLVIEWGGHAGQGFSQQLACLMDHLETIAPHHTNFQFLFHFCLPGPRREEGIAGRTKGSRAKNRHPVRLTGCPFSFFCPTYALLTFFAAGPFWS